jgi:hypothetical protein
MSMNCRLPCVLVLGGVMVALAAARPVATAPPAPSDAAYQQHVRQMTEKLKGQGAFTVVVAKPFVIAGNDTAEQLRATGVATVTWTVAHLKKDYFAKAPVEVIDIYLFKDKASYDKANKELFAGAPDTPYGYYSPRYNALVMNIATGGGTLVHEIVHPFISANFPNCPPWFNEGLASLYEQSMDRDGHIWGLPNWRLIDLKKTLTRNAANLPAEDDGAAPAFKALCAMDADAFYGKGKGPNYGVARYVCLYLQEKGVLRQFYKDFVANQKADPTGYATLQKTLAGVGEKDMNAFRKKWERWVMGLQYP